MSFFYYGQMTLSSLSVVVQATKTTSFRYLETQFGDGYRARRQDGVNPIMEKWAISTPAMATDKLVVLEQELEALGTDHFDWQAPDDDTVKKWVLDPIEWKRSYSSNALASISFTISRFYV